MARKVIDTESQALLEELKWLEDELARVLAYREFALTMEQQLEINEKEYELKKRIKEVEEKLFPPYILEMRKIQKERDK